MIFHKTLYYFLISRNACHHTRFLHAGFPGFWRLEPAPRPPSSNLVSQHDPHFNISVSVSLLSIASLTAATGSSPIHALHLISTTRFGKASFLLWHYITAVVNCNAPCGTCTPPPICPSYPRWGPWRIIRSPQCIICSGFLISLPALYLFKRKGSVTIVFRRYLQAAHLPSPFHFLNTCFSTGYLYFWRKPIRNALLSLG